MATERVPNVNDGEVKIELKQADGRMKDFILRPSFEAMQEIELMTGKGIPELARKTFSIQPDGSLVNDYRLGLNETTIILVACMKAAGEPASVKTVGPMLLRSGISSVAGQVVDLIGNAITGGSDKKSSGEEKAAGET